MRRRTFRIDDMCGDIYQPLRKRYRVKPGQQVHIKYTSGRMVECIARKKVGSCCDPESSEYRCVFKAPNINGCALSSLICYSTKPAVWLCPVSDLLEEL